MGDMKSTRVNLTGSVRFNSNLIMIDTLASSFYWIGLVERQSSHQSNTVIKLELVAVGKLELVSDVCPTIGQLVAGSAQVTVRIASDSSLWCGLDCLVSLKRPRKCNYGFEVLKVDCFSLKEIFMRLHAHDCRPQENLHLNKILKNPGHELG